MFSACSEVFSGAANNLSGLALRMEKRHFDFDHAFTNGTPERRGIRSAACVDKQK